MSTVTQPAAFDATVYDLPIPKLDGHKADHLALAFTGTIVLDRTNPKHLELLGKFKLGEAVNLKQVDVVCVGKPSTYKPAVAATAESDGCRGELTVRTVLRITDIHV